MVSAINCEEEVASSKRNAQLECTNHNLYNSDQYAQIDSSPKIANQTIPFGAAHAYRDHIREYPLGKMIDTFWIILLFGC